MARGGRREGAGRKPGSPNQRTSDTARKAAAAGLTPVEFLLRVMRNSKAPMPMRVDAAKAAAPYVHPRLSAILLDLKDLSDDDLREAAR